MVAKASVRRTAGGEVAGSILQKRARPDSVTYLGRGRLAEAKMSIP